jgi:type IV pilus assembly protein PilW
MMHKNKNMRQKTLLMTTFGQCSTRLNDSRQAGFSLVELMVGLIIGLLATLAIVQVFSIFEG